MSSQGKVKGHVFQKQAWRPLIFVCKKFNHKFNYTHTSLMKKLLKSFDIDNSVAIGASENDW